MLSPVWPLARLRRYSSLLFRAVEWPAYVRIIHGRSGWSSRWLIAGDYVRGGETPVPGGGERRSSVDSSRRADPGLAPALRPRRRRARARDPRALLLGDPDPRPHPRHR